MLEIIDISKNSADIKNQLLTASINQGFLFVKGHGIPQSHIDEMFKLSKDFFSLDGTLKNKHAITNNIGYTSLTQEQLDKKKSKDYKEAYNFGKIDFESGSFPVEDHPEIFQKNQLLVQKTNQLMYKVAQSLFKHLLTALEVDEAEINELDNCFDGDTNTVLRFLKYPQIRAVKEDVNDDIRAGAHTDYGLMAILFQQEGQEGLQLNLNEENDKDWVSIKYLHSDDPEKEGAPLVINFGDLLQFWTNGTIRSTVHRVVVPESRHADRYSMVFFVHPVFDTSLEAWNSKYIKKDAENKKNVTANEHLLMRLKETYI
ncbi:Clavaminate synthase-like protein [Hanseniaspora valbyensis NRRL Y-1626]|uniref:Clavaminate synthase-like protein n=1 Tax=Hanseniaspora valbyensis NRRL Y-1626 TaxID=766949 RepID=A0A1B7TE57_9ASCO|nr:Clavaminate synthase-like protein [Hanseniaspora valbyensis NRRL Y-1626]